MMKTSTSNVCLPAAGSEESRLLSIYLASAAQPTVLAAIVPYFNYLPFPNNVASWRRRAKIIAMLHQIVDERRASRANKATAPEDEILLDYLLDAADSGGSLTNEEVIAESLTFMLAGESHR